MPGLIWFEWEKCPDGYTIEELKPEYLSLSDRGEYIANENAPLWVKQGDIDVYLSFMDIGMEFGDHFLIPKSERVIKFEPIKEFETGTFLELADCFGSNAKILEFVSKFGVLYCGSMPSEELVNLASHYIEEIQKQAGYFKYAVDLWEEAKLNNNFEKLTHLFNKGFDAVDDADGYPDFTPSGTLYPRLKPSRAINTPPTFSIVPDSLGSALWLQFSQAVSANLMLRRCAVCPTWFAYGTGTGRRKSAHYCSDRCRKAAHRRQKLEKNNG